MNISNDILLKAVNAFVDALSEGIAQSVEAKVSERIRALEDKLNGLDVSYNERVEEGIAEMISDVIPEKINDYMNEVDFEKFEGFDDAVFDVVNNMTITADVSVRRF